MICSAENVHFFFFKFTMVGDWLTVTESAGEFMGLGCIACEKKLECDLLGVVVCRGRCTLPWCWRCFDLFRVFTIRGRVCSFYCCLPQMESGRAWKHLFFIVYLLIQTYVLTDKSYAIISISGVAGCQTSSCEHATPKKPHTQACWVQLPAF